MITLETTPETLACALIEQIISSRQPLPCSVLETPTTYLVVPPPPPDPPPHAARADAASSKAATNRPAGSGRLPSLMDKHLLCEWPLGLWLPPSSLPQMLSCAHLLSYSEAARRPPRVLSVGRFEQLFRSLAPHLGGARDHRRQLVLGEEQLRGADLDRVGDRDRRDGRARSDRRVGPSFEVDQRVARGRADVDHDVRLVQQPGAHGRLDLARLRLLDRGHGDHRQAPGPGSARHLHHDRAQPARREDEHRVVRRESKVGEDDLGETWRALDEYRLALAVGADDLGVKGHRELDDRVEARVRAVAGKHLLDRDPRVAGSEEVDEAARADGLRADTAGALDGLRLRVEDLLHERDPGLHPLPCGRHASATFASTCTASQCPLFIDL